MLLIFLKEFSEEEVWNAINDLDKEKVHQPPASIYPFSIIVGVLSMERS